MTTRILPTVCTLAVCGVLIVAGCKISHSDTGGDTKVSIEAPGASVKVDTATKANDSGIPLYPGAQEKPNAGGDNGKGRAHVNVDTPFLNVKVVALQFTSDDAPEKILAFYRNKLASYGTVLECKGEAGDVQLGKTHGTLNAPVTCDKEHGSAGEISLKVGTEGNQHMVAVKPSGKGTEFALVYIRLGTGKNDDYSGKQPS